MFKQEVRSRDNKSRRFDKPFIKKSKVIWRKLGRYGVIVRKIDLGDFIEWESDSRRDLRKSNNEQNKSASPKAKRREVYLRILGKYLEPKKVIVSRN